MQKHVLLVGKILSSSLETEKGCFGLRAADFEKIYYGRLDRPRKRVGIRDLLIQDGSELLLANVRSQGKETDKMGLRLSFPPRPVSTTTARIKLADHISELTECGTTAGLCVCNIDALSSHTVTAGQKLPDIQLLI